MADNHDNVTGVPMMLSFILLGAMVPTTMTIAAIEQDRYDADGDGFPRC